MLKVGDSMECDNIIKTLESYYRLEGIMKRIDVEIAAIEEKKSNIHTSDFTREKRPSVLHHDNMGELTSRIEILESKKKSIKATKDQIDYAITLLDEDQKIIIEECYLNLNGKSRIEISVDRNLSRSTLYRYEKKAIETIRKALEP